MRHDQKRRKRIKTGRNPSTMSRIKKAAATHGWEYPLLTSIYPGFDCGSHVVLSWQKKTTTRSGSLSQKGKTTTRRIQQLPNLLWPRGRRHVLLEKANRNGSLSQKNTYSQPPHSNRRTRLDAPNPTALQKWKASHAPVPLPLRFGSVSKQKTAKKKVGSFTLGVPLNRPQTRHPQLQTTHSAQNPARGDHHPREDRRFELRQLIRLQLRQRRGDLLILRLPPAKLGFGLPPCSPFGGLGICSPVVSWSSLWWCPYFRKTCNLWWVVGQLF